MPRAPRMRQAGAALLLAVAPSVAIAEAPPVRDWTFVVAPYIWLPAMTGNATAKGRTVGVETSISDLFSETDFVFALQAQFEAWHRRRWGLGFNGQWTILQQNNNSFGPQDGPPFGPGIFPIKFDLDMNLGLFEFLGLYNAGEWQLGSEPQSPLLTAQAMLGARVTVMRIDLEPSGSGPDVDHTESWADPILGARAGIHFGPERRLSWVVRADFGGFGAGSDFTWNVLGRFGYDFRVGKAMSTLGIGARALYQDFDDGGGSNRFAWDVTQYGPALFWSFRF